MAHFIFKLLGFVCVLSGITFAVPFLILLNQRCHIIRTHWAIFDTEIDGVPVSDAAAAAITGGTAVALLSTGAVILFRYPRKTAR